MPYAQQALQVGNRINQLAQIRSFQGRLLAEIKGISTQQDTAKKDILRIRQLKNNRYKTKSLALLVVCKLWQGGTYTLHFPSMRLTKIAVHQNHRSSSSLFFQQTGPIRWGLTNKDQDHTTKSRCNQHDDTRGITIQ